MAFEDLTLNYTGATLTQRINDILGVVRAYDLRTGFSATPTAGEVLDVIMVARALTLPANLAGSVGSIGTNPGATMALSLQDDGVEVATVSISTGGVFTFATASGLAVSIAAGSRLTLVGPDPAVTSAALCSITLKAELTA